MKKSERMDDRNQDQHQNEPCIVNWNEQWTNKKMGRLYTSHLVFNSKKKDFLGIKTPSRENKEHFWDQRHWFSFNQHKKWEDVYNGFLKTPTSTKSSWGKNTGRTLVHLVQQHLVHLLLYGWLLFDFNRSGWLRLPKWTLSNSVRRLDKPLKPAASPYVLLVTINLESQTMLGGWSLLYSLMYILTLSGICYW